MKITAFIHPSRGFLPCSGVGRHMNAMLTHLSATPGIDIELLFSRQWLAGDGKLPEDAPLRKMRFRTFPMAENPTERRWKLTGRPVMDRWVGEDTDWVYCPMETYFPTTRCPVAITIHDIQAFEPDLPWSRSLKHRAHRLKWGLWVARAIRRSQLVLTVSEFSKRRMVELLGADAEKIVVVGNGVDPAFFDTPRAQAKGNAPAGEGGGRPYVLLVGGVRAAKGGRHVLQVARELKARGSDLHFVVAGGPDDVAQRREAEALGRFSFAGQIDDSELRRLLGGAQALFFPSLYEGFGLPPLEAMAAGVPVVAADRASLKEVVGDAGILVDPEDPGQSADVLERLVASETLRRELAGRGRERALEFTWERCARRLLDALESREERLAVMQPS